MMRRVLASSGGFTYMTVLVIVVVVGIAASRGAIVWKTAMQREKEIELISRGTQVRDALRRWYRVRVVPGDTKVTPIDPRAGAVASPTELKALLKDPSRPGNVRYLRPIALIDPLSEKPEKEWEVIRDGGRIIGVKSSSEKEPLKQGNFPLDLHPADFEKKKKYSEWEFRYDRVPPLLGTNPPPLPEP
uniref:Type II secretion system protein n=1 Tax=Geobacter sp. (strain M21) TaxID=443144 RepID=C6DY76_GEOSM